jgi:peptidoglycan/LPS O-acetylase OafA/YrhL
MMGRGRSRSRRRDDYDDRRDRDDGYSRRKSRDEERIERFTWFFLVIIIALIHISREGGLSFPNFVTPLAGGIVLVGSGMYQYSRRWRVSPITWLGGALLIGMAIINLYYSPTSNFLGISLIVFAGVILIGLLTGET